MKKTLEEIGEIKPEIESIKAGKGVIYQSVEFKKFGRSTFSKVVGKPVYKQMSIRNYSTATKLLDLMKDY